MKQVRWRVIAGGAGVLALGAITLMTLAVGGIVGWEYSNSDAFCTNACHAVHPEEPVAHAQSAHGRVHCVECHIGRLPTLKVMALKSEHFHELWGVIAGYERPVHAKTLKPARIACESCHWPATTHRDSVVLKKRYAEDERNTETTTRLVLHTGFNVLREADANGVHWHVETPVEYVALDDARQQIPWVRVTHQDGTVETYIDQTLGDPASYAQAPKKVMDCIDCHNAVGHPFPNPEDRIDDLMAHGEIDRKLPNVKAKAMDMAEAVYALDERGEATPEAVEGIVSQGVADYKETLDGDVREPVVNAFGEVMKTVLNDSTFAAEGITWRTFPNNAGHKDFPGCFRCHDGKHLNEQGESIRLQCNLCHNLPEVQVKGGPAPVKSTVIPGVKQPRSHGEPNFMHEHRFKLDASCKGCHGEIKFGREGGSFCSNPACHGRQWPEVNLNVSRN